jgi:hypothetical protein
VLPSRPSSHSQSSFPISVKAEVPIPTVHQTDTPTGKPTEAPTADPTVKPTYKLTSKSTRAPTWLPTNTPTVPLTDPPNAMPAITHTEGPKCMPFSRRPTVEPTNTPRTGRLTRGPRRGQQDDRRRGQQNDRQHDRQHDQRPNVHSALDSSIYIPLDDNNGIEGIMFNFVACCQSSNEVWNSNSMVGTAPILLRLHFRRLPLSIPRL